MFLVKFTDPQWKQSAIRGESIRIGSVLHYREIDDLTFRDEDEGEGVVVYKSEQPLDAETHNRIFANEGIQLSDGWKIDTGGVPLFSQKSIFNPFVYSCSLVQHKSEISRIAKRFNKKSWYFINDVWKFVEQVSAGLQNYIITQSNINPDLEIPDIVRGKLHQLEMLPIIGKVHYSDGKKEQIVNNLNAKHFQPRTVELEPYFRKPMSFKDEKEFRMIWIPNLGSMKNDDFDLMSTPFRTIDLSLSNHGMSARPRSIKEILDKEGAKIA